MKTEDNSRDDVTVEVGRDGYVKDPVTYGISLESEKPDVEKRQTYSGSRNNLSNCISKHLTPVDTDYTYL
jgi:hypothetical protein